MRVHAKLAAVAVLFLAACTDSKGPSSLAGPAAEQSSFAFGADADARWKQLPAEQRDAYGNLARAELERIGALKPPAITYIPRELPGNAEALILRDSRGRDLLVFSKQSANAGTMARAAAAYHEKLAREPRGIGARPSALLVPRAGAAKSQPGASAPTLRVKRGEGATQKAGGPQSGALQPSAIMIAEDGTLIDDGSGGYTTGYGGGGSGAYYESDGTYVDPYGVDQSAFCAPGFNARYMIPSLGMYSVGFAQRITGFFSWGNNVYEYNGSTLNGQWRVSGYGHVAQGDCRWTWYHWLTGIPAELAFLHDERLTNTGSSTTGGGDGYGGGGYGGGGGGGGGSGCYTEYIFIEISYDGGATWSTWWEGYATVCG